MKVSSCTRAGGDAAGLLLCLIRGRDINEAQREVKDGSFDLGVSSDGAPVLGKRVSLEGLCKGQPRAARVMVLGGWRDGVAWPPHPQAR